MTARSLAALALGAAALTSAGPASAATVSMPFHSHAGSSRVGPQDYYRFTLVAAAGEANRITIEGGSPTSIRVADPGAPLSAGDNCRADGDGVLCSVGGPVPTFLVGASMDLGDGSDELTVTGMTASVNGGPGDDRINFPNNGITVDGGPGADFIRAAGGSVTYAGRMAGVSVSPDGMANDGEPGEGDDIGSTFLWITGGNGDDELHAVDTPQFRSRLDGSSGNDRLFGGAGTDELIGGGGNDSLLGGDGPDELDGGVGGDVLRGGDGFDMAFFRSAYGIDVTLDDRPGDGEPGENDDAGSDLESVFGSPRDDRIVGSDGPNRIFGGGGKDHLDGASGPDTLGGGDPGSRVIGGAGSDAFWVRGTNALIEARDGERDEISCGGSGHTYAIDPFDSMLNCIPVPLRPERSTIRVRRDGTVGLNLRCSYGDLEDTPCEGKLYLYHRGHEGFASPLARARFTLPRGAIDPELVEMRLTRSARRKLAARRRLLVSLQWRVSSEQPPTTETDEYDLKLLAPLKR